MAISKAPAKALAIVAFVLVGAWLVNTYAASSTSKYLASVAQCPDQKVADTSRKADMEKAMRCMINYARKVHGDSQLNDATLLEASAADKGRDIISCSSVSHTACGRSLTYWFYRDGYLPGSGSSLVGENLGWGSGSDGSARNRMIDWLNSSSHRANVFQSKFNGQGMNVRHTPYIHGASDVYIWVNHYGCHNGGC